MKTWHVAMLLVLFAFYASGPTGSMRSIVPEGDK